MLKDTRFAGDPLKMMHVEVNEDHKTLVVRSFQNILVGSHLLHATPKVIVSFVLLCLAPAAALTL